MNTKINQVWMPLCLILALFAIPISSTAKSIFLVLAVILILSNSINWQDLRAVFTQFWCQATVALFMIALLACFWGPASLNEKMLILEKYSKLLYLPILVVGFQKQKTCRIALDAYLLAMAITFIASISANGLDPGAVFRNHIMTGYMMAFAAYIAALLCIDTRQMPRKIIYALLALLFSLHVCFINTGRTGYVVYCLLVVLFLMQHLSWRQAVLACTLSGVVFFTLYSQNSMINSNVNRAVADWHNYKHNSKDTSIGYRLQFHAFAYDLFQRHPILGNGTGSFTHYFQVETPVPSWDRKLLEPHSLYWLIAAEFGIVGLVALMSIFASLLGRAFSRSLYANLMLAVLLSFLLGNMSDSLLFYSGTGYFFIMVVALCVSRVSAFKTQVSNAPSIDCTTPTLDLKHPSGHKIS